MDRDGNLFYLPAEPQALEEGWKIQTITKPDGHIKVQIVQPQRINKVIIAPTSATSTGARPIMGGNTDIWIVKGNYVIRVHKRLRRAKFTPENTQCPVPTEQLDEWRQTTVRRPGQEDMIYTDNYPSVEPKFYRELIPGEHWKGETTFRLKTTATGQQLSRTGTTASGQQASTSTPVQAPNTTPRTRATVKRAPTSEEQQVQAPSRVKPIQERTATTPSKSQKTVNASTPMVVLNDEQDGLDTIYNHDEHSSYLLMDQDIHQHLHLNHTVQRILLTYRQMKYHRARMNGLQQTCLQNFNTLGKVPPPLPSKTRLNLHLRTL